MSQFGFVKVGRLDVLSRLYVINQTVDSDFNNNYEKQMVTSVKQTAEKVWAKFGPLGAGGNPLKSSENLEFCMLYFCLS